MLLFIHSLDIFILETVNLFYRSVLLDNISLLVSYMGVIYFWIIISLLLYLFGNAKGKSTAKKMIIVLVVVVILSQIFKVLMMRPRPYTQLQSLVVLATENDFSFPSGHTSVSTAMAYVLSREYDMWYIMIIPILVAFSRMYIGVHYPTDLIGGFVLGLIVSYLIENYLNFNRFEI